VNPANISDAGEIERGVAAFGRAPNGGLIVTPVGAILGLERSRDLITTLAARHKLPAVYWDRFFAATGGLISYGADYIVTPRPRTQHRFDCCAASSFRA
jgi:putative ABC transport system substrate-binding protein